MDRSGINRFCFSKLWQNQVTSVSPRAIDESEFIVAGSGMMSSAEGRRNYTDLQETSQWLGGFEFCEVILRDLLPLSCLSLFTSDFFYFMVLLLAI